MAFPNYKNKHLGQPMMFADQYGDSRKKFLGKLPDKCIIFYQSDAFEYLLKKLKGKAKKIKVQALWGCKTYATKDFIFVKMKGVGSPHAILMLESLIVLGVKEFLNLGAAGGLKELGYVVCDRAIRDEGTSYHYLPHSKYSYPDKELTEKLENSFKNLKIKYMKGTSWTIDAALMETKAEIQQYKKEGVLSVEMEASAMFAVAKLKKVKMAAAFFITDIFGEKSKHKHMKYEDIKYYQEGLKTIANIALDCFSKKEVKR